MAAVTCLIEWVIFREQSVHTWTQVFVVLFLLFVTFWFFSEAEIETVILDRKSQQLLITQ